MILMIDNYDSFTYNLVQYFGELGADLVVFRNDKILIDQIEKLNPEKIVISPGPCTPNKAGISCQVIKHYAGRVPILGVCLGHQCIGQVFGGNIVRANRLMHGKTSPIYHKKQEIFLEEGMTELEIIVTRLAESPDSGWNSTDLLSITPRVATFTTIEIRKYV